MFNLCSNLSNMNFSKKDTSIIVQNFELETTKDTLSEDELLDLLAGQVAYMIEYRMDYLLSLLYRLDVLEHKINHALSPVAVDPPALGLAKLILERQKQRIATKAEYRQEASAEDMEGLEW